MTTPPRVTVLMPVYNTARYLPATLNSLLKQTFRDFEALVIDDGSKDDTPDVIARYDDPRIIFVQSQGNAGLAARLNEGLERARAPLVARLDGDDIMHPERLARQVAALEADPKLALLGTNKVNIDAQGGYATANFFPTTPTQITWSLCFDNPFCHPSVMFRREIVWKQLGGYDPSLRDSEDYELWSRLNRAGHRLNNLDEVLMAYRRHTSSMTARLQDLRYTINVKVIRDNVRFAFPNEPTSELDDFASAIVDVNFRRRPCDRAFVARYWRYAETFMKSRGVRTRDMRRVLANHLLAWGSLAKASDRVLSLQCAVGVARLELAQLTAITLPGPVRNLLARRLGHFWVSAAQ